MDLDSKLNQYFSGKVVRKDLTKLIKEWQNVPIYVLEYLLGMYASTDDQEQIDAGVNRVKNILSENYVRPDEAEKIKSKIKEKWSHTVIDKLTVKLDEKNDKYIAYFSNLGLKDVVIESDIVKKYEKLLAGGIWCILQLSYQFEEGNKKNSPFKIESLKPIQLPNVDVDEVKENRKFFSKEEWISLLLRSVGMESENFSDTVKWHLLERLVPLVENNYNYCELWPRSTGKSHVYKEISPNSILISGWQSSVANLFYNISTRSVWLVWLWDVVAFDEVAGITFKDKDGIQIMKDYMNSGSFARGKEEKSATASMVFVWNINQSIDSLLKTSHLFAPFPDAMNSDTAFFDRMHYYLPGWEIPKFRPESFTDKFGFIVDYLAEYFREMRKYSFADGIDKYFKLWKDLNQRDVQAVRKTFSWLMKLLYPDEIFTKEDAEEVLRYAMMWRKRVKEQLKKMWGMEFYDVHFSYIEKDSLEEKYIALPEMWGGKIIPEWQNKPWVVYSISAWDTNMKWVYIMETQLSGGTGKLTKSWISGNGKTKENIDMAFNYFKANAKSISWNINTKEKDYFIQVQDLQWVGMSEELTLAAFIALCSISLDKSLQPQLVVLGTMTIGWTINKLENLADTLQVCSDAGANKVLLPMSSAGDLWWVPAELISKFQIIFYQNPQDAVFKALWVN
jgi:ATP-dependent Lon protease